MKIKCDVINDLLPLYVDDVLSDASRELVDEHIKECGSCRKTLENMSGKVSIPVSPELRKDDTKPIKGLKKIVTKWKGLTVLIAVLAVLAVLFLGFLYINAKQVDIPYDGSNFTFELRENSYYLVYHGRGSFLITSCSTTSSPDINECSIEFKQTLFEKYIWPLYHDKECALYLCEKDTITKLTTFDGRVIWEANEEEVKAYREWVAAHSDDWRNRDY